MDKDEKRGRGEKGCRVTRKMETASIKARKEKETLGTVTAVDPIYRQWGEGRTETKKKTEGSHSHLRTVVQKVEWNGTLDLISPTGTWGSWASWKLHDGALTPHDTRAGRFDAGPAQTSQE